MTTTSAQTPPRQWLTVEQAGQILFVGRRVVGRYIDSGKLKASKIGKRWLVARDSVDAFIQSRQKN